MTRSGIGSSCGKGVEPASSQPWHGWVWESRDYAFIAMDISPWAATKDYRTMVNSYLHFAVEGGVLPLT